MNDRVRQRFLDVAEFVRIQSSRTVGTLTSSATTRCRDSRLRPSNTRTVLFAMIAWLATLSVGARVWAQNGPPAGKPAAEQKTGAAVDSNMPDISGVWSIESEGGAVGAKTAPPAENPAGEQKTGAAVDSNMPDISGVWSIESEGGAKYHDAVLRRSATNENEFVLEPLPTPASEARIRITWKSK